MTEFFCGWDEDYVETMIVAMHTLRSKADYLEARIEEWANEKYDERF